CLRRGFDLLRIHYGQKHTIGALIADQYDNDHESRPVYTMIQRADTIGTFQIESRAQMSMLPRLRPQEFYDLVIEVAIVRAGTIQYFEEKFVKGMVARGYDPAFAENCFSQIRGFGEYGFPESHAASFANLVYVSCWMKCYYPDVFAAALLNSQPMGFYAPAQIVRDAREHGVDVRPIDVNHSDWDCTLELLSQSVIPGPSEARSPESITMNRDYGFRAQPVGLSRNDGGEIRIHPRHASMQHDIRTTHALRLGLRQISGFSEEHGLRIESVRGRGFDSVRDLWLRTRLPPSVL